MNVKEGGYFCPCPNVFLPALHYSCYKNMQKEICEIRSEIATLAKNIKARLAYEKSFGVTAIRKTDSNKPQKENTTSPPATRNKQDDIELLSLLKENALKCTLCELHRKRTTVVFGDGNPNADLMFVGEAPGYYEDIKGLPFVGKAGELLTKILSAIDLKREDVYIANILKCRPPENRNPKPNEIALCYPYLEKQIDLIKPKIICALGTFAIQSLLNTTESIGRLRGRFHDYQGTKLIATYHPAYLLRNPQEKRKTWEDVQKVRDYLKNL